jgi:hypothetical protein
MLDGVPPLFHFARHRNPKERVLVELLQNEHRTQPLLTLAILFMPDVAADVTKPHLTTLKEDLGALLFRGHLCASMIVSSAQESSPLY